MNPVILYRVCRIAHRWAIQLKSLKLKSLLRKCRTPKLWVMDFNSQHFRLEIANFYKKSLFIDKVFHHDIVHCGQPNYPASRQRTTVLVKVLGSIYKP